jgi:hypothetical protein
VSQTPGVIMTAATSNIASAMKQTLRLCNGNFAIELLWRLVEFLWGNLVQPPFT